MLTPVTSTEQHNYIPNRTTQLHPQQDNAVTYPKEKHSPNNTTYLQSQQNNTITSPREQCTSSRNRTVERITKLLAPVRRNERLWGTSRLLAAPFISEITGRILVKSGILNLDERFWGRIQCPIYSSVVTQPPFNSVQSVER
jgi:hypothetical protein